MKEKSKLPLVCAILFFCAVPFIVLGNTIYSVNILNLIFSSSVSIAIGVGILLKKDLVIVIASGVNVATEIIYLLMYSNTYYDYYYGEYVRGYRFVDYICDIAPLSAGLVCAVVLFLFVLFLFLPKFKNKENIAKLWIFPAIMFLIYSSLTISSIILSVAYFMLFNIYSKRDYNTDIKEKNDKKIPVNQANEKPALDIVTSLKILKAKLDAGSITEEEYNLKRKDLLGL